MKGLNHIVGKDERLVVGLMSGTSMDGIDAALLRINGKGLDTNINLLKFICVPYDSSLLSKMESLVPSCSLESVSSLNFLVGEAFANAALAAIEEAGFNVGDIDIIGSHGQTVFHNPPSFKSGISSTLQIGELDVIAELTGITTIGDFRTRDIAAGGEGAPLVPYVDYILFHDDKLNSIAQNIGGIANATVITNSLQEVIAFDTGPGNLLMDSVMRLYTHGRQKYDKDGEIASKGEVNTDVLKKLLSNPYFYKSPPKSTGMEMFGREIAEELYELVKLKEITIYDLMRTVLELTVESIAISFERFIFPKWQINEIILSGGGCKNHTLVERLRERLECLKISTSFDYGIPVEAKEAVAFAVLANELISGNYTNLTRVTGARNTVPQGKISLGRYVA